MQKWCNVSCKYTLSINVEVIAAIVLAELLGSPLGGHLSPEGQSAAGSLRQLSRERMNTLQELGSHGLALGRVMERANRIDVFNRKQMPNIDEVINLLISVRDLTEQLQEAGQYVTSAHMVPTSRFT